MKEFNNKVYRLLTYGVGGILYFFRKAFIVFGLYTWWVIFRLDTKHIIVAVVLWALLAALILYVHHNKIVYIPPAPRKSKPKQEEQKQDAPVEEFVMQVDENAFSSFTFNDYVVDTFKKQDANKIIDLLADQNKLILEELKR